MFRSARWRSDKNRVKAVFKLHFHATQVFQSGMDALVLSIVPGDIGKPTTKLEKATVRDGTCRWENPVYETVKFVQEAKTGKVSDRIYHFLVSTGLPKASSIGEVSINFANYAEATKPSSVSLPIRISHCDAVLHVSIQRLQENGVRREEDECEVSKLKSDDRSSRSQLNNGDTDETSKSYSSEDVSAKAIMNRTELSSNYRTSSGSDITLSSSDDSSGLDTPREIGPRKKNIHLNTKGFLPDPVLHHASEPQNLARSASTSMDDVHQRSHWDWSAGSEHRLSIDDATYHNSPLKERSQQPSPLEIESLNAEVSALARQVDVSDLELQTLRKQIVKECKRGQDLTKEIVALKGERDAFKTECESLRSFQKRMEEAQVRNRSQLEGGDLHALVEEIRQELDYEKGLNANLRLQLKKMQESNAELVLAVQDLDEMLEQKNSDMCKCNHSCANERDKNSPEKKINLSKCETDDDDDEEQKALEELVKEHTEAKETHLLEKKIVDLYGEIDMYRRDKDELEMQMEQLALDYEILKQENHGLAHKLEQSELQEQLKMQYECSSSPSSMNDIETHIKNLENQLKEQSEDFTNSLATIKALETHIRNLEEEMEKQAQGFEADLEAVTREKVEQEQRAIQAEETLRKTRLKNAQTAERLQEEFRRLSTQMTTTFDANEKATMKALTEASEVRAQRSVQEEQLHKVKEELESTTAEYEVKLNQLSNKSQPPPEPVTEVHTIKLYRTTVMDVDYNGYSNSDESRDTNFDKFKCLELREGDASAIYNYFCRMKLTDPNFFYLFDIDDDGHLKNVFWADSRSRIAHNYFNDTVTIDTTCLANKYEIPLISFVGVNHHGHSILLGCGFLGHESVDYFVWIFKAWLKCMLGRPPHVVITDQCKTLQIAVAQVFPHARHCYSLQYIMQRVPEKLGGLQGYEAIRRQMYNAVYHSLKIVEFESSWTDMIKCHGLGDNKWIQTLYKDRHLWVPVYLKDVFFVGLISTKENEGLTAFFDGYVHKHTSFKEFLDKYDLALHRKHLKEAMADLETRKESFEFKTRCNFEAQLSKVYTEEIFKKFQTEVEGMYSCFNTRQVNVNGSIITYIVKERVEVEGNEKGVKSFEVLYETTKLDIRCICSLLNYKGYLCRHALNVLNYNGVEEIPSRYILRRWTRDFKQTFNQLHASSNIDTYHPVHLYTHLFNSALPVLEVGAQSQEHYMVAVKELQELLDKFDIEDNNSM